MMPAMDSTPLSSAMTHMVSSSVVGLAVERQQPSRRRLPRRTTRLPATLAASKTCSGRPRSKVTIVGDVDQRVDRPQADGAQPLLQPLRATGRS